MIMTISMSSVVSLAEEAGASAEQNAAAEGLEAEETVTVNPDTAASSNGQFTITGFAENTCISRLVYREDERPSLDTVTSEMPTRLSVYLDDTKEIAEIPVTWECVGLDYSEADYYYYQFSPVFEDSYVLAENIDLILGAPYVSVEFLFEDDYEAYLAAADEVSALGAVSSQSANEKKVFEYLTGTMKLNIGAACGVMANIYAESTFRPTASHTESNGSVSYGICQWNGTRKTRLENYCTENGYDYTTIDGQMHYLEYELKNYYKSTVYTPITQVENSADGAYSAAYTWCVKFEIPANKETVGATRGNSAKNTFWPEYKNSSTGTSEETTDPDAKITLSESNVTAKAIASKMYSGLPYCPVPNLTCAVNGKKVRLVAGKDFTVAYADNIEPGTATVTVTGNGKYEGTLTYSYTITKRDLKKAKIFANDLLYKSGDSPELYVYYGNEILEEGVDYTVAENSSLTDIATKRKVIINAVDDETSRYTGTKDVTVTVLQNVKMLTRENVSFAEEGPFSYTGKAIKPLVGITYDGVTLDAKNYSITYKNNINAGTGLVVVTGKKEFGGKLYIPFEISPCSGSFTLAAGIRDQKYKGTYLKPKPRVLFAGKKLTENKDYILTYSNNIGPSDENGNAEILIEGIGNYSDVEDLTTGFMIVK